MKMLVSGQTIENAAKILSADGDRNALKKLFYPEDISEEMLDRLNQVAGKEFVVDGRR